MDQKTRVDFEAPLPCPCKGNVEYHQKASDDVIWLKCSGGAVGDLYLCPAWYVRHMDHGGDDGGPCELCSYCQDCPALLTECDVEARQCTQCGWPIDKLKPVYSEEKVLWLV